MHGFGRHKHHIVAITVLLAMAIILLHAAVAALVWHGHAAAVLDQPLSYGLAGAVILAMLVKAVFAIAWHVKRRRHTRGSCPS